MRFGELLRGFFADDSVPEGFFSSRCAYARQMGEDAAIGLSIPWDEAQLVLRGIWRQESSGLHWEEAKPIVHYAWRITKEAMRTTS